MKITKILLVIFIFLLSHLRAATITTIEQLDSAAVFSFAIMSDNMGVNSDGLNSTTASVKQNATSFTRMSDWVKANDEFCLGVGDHIFGSSDKFNDVMLNDPYFHNHFYPIVGDHDNETKLYYGVTGTQNQWGRGWVILQSLNNFFNRPDVEFRPKQSTQVLSGGVYYDDQLIDYYAKRQHSGFTVHILGLHYGDSSAFAPRTKDFMISKLQALAAVKTNHDIVVVLAHSNGSFFKNAIAGGYMNQAEIDYVMNNSDLVCDASNHIYGRHTDYDGRYDGTEALWINTGAVVNTGDTHGYVNIHVFDNPPRFTQQFIDVQRQSTRKLHVGPKPFHSSNVTDAQTVPMLKYIDGAFMPVDWNNFATSKPVVSFNTPSGNVTLNVGDNLYVKVNATDSDGTISVVKLYKNNVELSRSETEAPYEWNASGQNDLELKNLQAGNFILQAIATDNAGNTGHAIITVTVGSPVNLVQNGSFETGGTAPTSWTLGSGASGSTDTAKLGAASLKLSGAAAVTKQTIAVQANKNYSISVWIYNPGATAGSVVFDTNDAFDGPGQGQFVVAPGGASTWTKYSGSFNTGSVTSVTLRIFGSAAVGTAYFDDVVLSLAPNTPPIFTSTAVKNATEGTSYSYTVKAIDVENNTLTYNQVILPAWLTFTPSSRLLTGTPTFANIGSHNVTLRVSDGTVNTDQSFTITVAALSTPFEDWKIVNDVSDDLADDDGDGITNLMEFALGGNPRISDSDRKPHLVRNDTNLDFTFHRAESTITYTIEKSTDLMEWSTHVVNPGTIGSDVTVSVADGEMNNGKLFLRLKIQN